MNSSALELYEFVMRYNKYIYQARDYGNGDEIRMVEVHTLAMIEDNPGISVSELAKTLEADQRNGFGQYRRAGKTRVYSAGKGPRECQSGTSLSYSKGKRTEYHAQDV